MPGRPGTAPRATVTRVVGARVGTGPSRVRGRPTAWHALRRSRLRHAADCETSDSRTECMRAGRRYSYGTRSGRARRAHAAGRRSRCSSAIAQTWPASPRPTRPSFTSVDTSSPRPPTGATLCAPIAARSSSGAAGAGATSMPSGAPVSRPAVSPAGTTQTLAGTLRIAGVCIPWRGVHVSTGRRDRAPWADHLAYLDGLADIARDLHGPPHRARRLQPTHPACASQPELVATRLAACLEGWFLPRRGGPAMWR
jgi:hypothetical protein